MCVIMSEEEIGNIVYIFLCLSKRITAETEAKRVIFVILSMTKCLNIVGC